MKRRLITTVVLLALAVLTGTEFVRTIETRQDLVYARSLSKVAVTIDDKELTLSDVAFYVAYQEKTVQQDAVIYDPEKPHKYWNAHTNGEFVRVVAEQAIVDMAVHDEIFYQLAIAEGIALDEREEAYLANEIYDFCSDVTEEQLEKVGMTTADVALTMSKIALANKYQSILAQMENVEYTEYDYTGSVYADFIAGYEIVVNESVWDRISVGNITVNNK